MNHNQSISTFRRSLYSSRRKRIDSHFIHEHETHLQSSIGDTPVVHDLFEHIIVQPSTVIHYNDYLYMIYLFVLAIFYICYITMILHGKSNLLDDHEQYYYFDNYEREIPRLLWFRKGYRLR